MSVFDNEKHVLAGRTTSSDHVVSMNMAADAQRPLTKSCVHQTCIDGGSESLINQNYTNRSTSIEIDRTRARKSKTSDNIQKEKKSEGWRSNGCTCSISLVSICLSLLLLGAVTYIYFTREETNVLETVTPAENIKGEMSRLQGNVDEKIYARFELDQYLFNSTNRQNMSWNPVTNSKKAIRTEGSCIVVPERGTYGIFSVITFLIEKNDSVRQLVHTIKLPGLQPGEKHFLRKIFAVPKPDDRNSPEFIPSTFVSFSALEANGRICVDTNNRKFLFISAIDNNINIFKVS